MGRSLKLAERSGVLPSWNSKVGSWAFKWGVIRMMSKILISHRPGRRYVTPECIAIVLWPWHVTKMSTTKTGENSATIFVRTLWFIHLLILCFPDLSTAQEGSLEARGQWTAYENGSALTPPMGWASWKSMLASYDAAVGRALYAGPGTWNDPDMMHIGNGDFSWKHLDHARAHFSLWSILAAPLILGTNLQAAHPAILDLITNPEVIAVNQDSAGNQGVKVFDDGNREIIIKALSDPHRKAVVLLNRNNTQATMSLSLKQLKFRAGSEATVRDIWASKNLGAFSGKFTTDVPPHGVRMLLVTGTPEIKNCVFLSDMPGSINIAVKGAMYPKVDKTVENSIQLLTHPLRIVKTDRSPCNISTFDTNG